MESVASKNIVSQEKFENFAHQILNLKKSFTDKILGKNPKEEAILKILRPLSNARQRKGNEILKILELNFKDFIEENPYSFKGEKFKDEKEREKYIMSKIMEGVDGGDAELEKSLESLLQENSKGKKTEILNLIKNKILEIEKELENDKAQKAYQIFLQENGFSKGELLSKDQIQVLIMAYLMDERYNAYVKKGYIPKGKIEKLPEKEQLITQEQAKSDPKKRDKFLTSILCRMFKGGRELEEDGNKMLPSHFQGIFQPLGRGNSIPKTEYGIKISDDFNKTIVDSKLFFGKYLSFQEGNDEYFRAVDAINLTNFAKLNGIKLKTKEELEREKKQQKVADEEKKEKSKKPKGRFDEINDSWWELEKQRQQSEQKRQVRSILFFLFSSAFCTFSVLMSISYFNLI